ncbi:MAG: DUF368 domain-containing protein [Chitinophagales bacterium]
MKKTIGLFFRGMAMGAADVVPGVSGGTIAFITGIYEELLRSIKSVDLEALKLLLKSGPKAFWEKINGTFLLALFTGIIFSVISLAKGITYLLNEHPVLIWSFFFGLIIASAIYIGKDIPKWNIRNVFALLVAALVAFYITLATPTQGPEALWFIFLSGFIAICAMILPGISGSFILLLLGSYPIVLGTVSDTLSAIKASDWDLIVSGMTLILIFILGCVIGLMSFARLLSWLFAAHKNLTLAILTGFMIGSLNKVWPWKETLEFRINSKGEEVPFLEQNILPAAYEQLYNTPSQLLPAIVLMVFGFGIVFLIEGVAKKMENK